MKTRVYPKFSLELVRTFYGRSGGASSILLVTEQKEKKIPGGKKKTLYDTVFD